MRRPAPLPPQVPRGPFAVRDAADLGLGRGRLRRSDVCRPLRGVVQLRPALGVDAETPARGDLTTDLDAASEGVVLRARTASLVLPEDHAWSHHTALDLLRLPSVRVRGEGEPLHVISPSDRPRLRLRNVRGHRGLDIRAVDDVDGLKVVAAPDTWCDLGELIGADRLGLGDLVLVGDAILRRAADRAVATGLDEGMCEHGPDPRGARERLAAAGAATARQELARTLDSRVRPRGKLLLLEALPLLRHRSRSPQESRSRIVMLQAGLPEPLLNEGVFARDGSGLLGEFDFVWRLPLASRGVDAPVVQRRLGVVAEYQGVHHADRQQRSADEIKRRLVEEEGWVFVPIWAEDLTNLSRQFAMIQRIREGLIP